MTEGIFATIFFEGEHATKSLLTSGMHKDMSEMPYTRHKIKYKNASIYLSKLISFIKYINICANEILQLSYDLRAKT